MILVDDLRQPNDPDDTNAFLEASEYSAVECSNRVYTMNGDVQIKAGQMWRLNGATIKHTDNSKVMFTATDVNCWSMIGPGKLLGTLTTRGEANEKGLAVSGCNEYRVHGITARCFLGAGFHISGNYSGFKSDQGKWSDCTALESMTGLQINSGSGSEYNVFTNFSAIGNIVGALISAGNTQLIGGNICENLDVGLLLTGGENSGHGICVGLNINHNPTYSLKADAVTSGFTFSACHLYGDNAGSGWIWLLNGSQDVAFYGGVIDAKVQHDSTGTNRVFNAKTYSNYSVGGSNPSGFVASGNF